MEYKSIIELNLRNIAKVIVDIDADIIALTRNWLYLQALKDLRNLRLTKQGLYYKYLEHSQIKKDTAIKVAMLSKSFLLPTTKDLASNELDL